MKKIFYLLLCLAVPMLCNAQLWEKLPDGTVVAKYENPVHSVEKQNPKQTGTCTITLQSSDAPLNAWFVVSDNDKRFTMTRTPSKKLPIKVEPGTYVIGGVFIGGRPTVNIAIHENVTITGDTVITIGRSMATTLVKFEALNPAGKIPVLPHGTYNPQFTIDDYTGADVRTINIVNQLSYKGLNLGSLTGTEVARINNDDGTRSYDYKVSKISDKFEFSQYRAYETLDGDLYLVHITGRGASSDTTYSNNPADFKPISVKFDSLPEDNELLLEDYRWGLLTKKIIDGKDVAGRTVIQAFTPKPNPDMKVCVATNGIPSNYSVAMPQIFRASVSYKEGTLHKASGTYTQPFVYQDGEWRGINVGVSALPSFEFWNISDKIGTDQSVLPSWNKPSQRIFGFNLSKPYRPLLNSVPIASVNPYILSEAWAIIPYFIGRNGEMRDMDVASSDYEIRNMNGQLLQHGKGAVAIKSVDGPIKISFTNKNMKIRDGIKGYCKVELNLDPTKEDPFAPSLQMLMIVDKNNCPVDSFEKVDVYNHILFSAGDFNYDKINQLYHDAEASDITVEYAPNGSSDFSKLNYMPLNGNTVTHMLGRQYFIVMNQVTKTSPNGWFDLRFTIKDAAGNQQTQVISPAFYVNSLKNGVAGIVDDNITIIGGKGKITAPENAKVYTLTGTRCGTENLAPGIYIVCVGNKTVKTVVY